MTEHAFVVRARRALTPEGERPVSVVIDDGRITGVLTGDEAPVEAEGELRLAGDEVLLPGLVDSHVHVNEPGRTEWEGFASATRAASRRSWRGPTRSSGTSDRGSTPARRALVATSIWWRVFSSSTTAARSRGRRAGTGARATTSSKKPSTMRRSATSGGTPRASR